MQPVPFLFPPIVFGLGALLDSLCLGLDRRGPFSVLALGLVQRRLRFFCGLVAPFAIPLPGGLLSPALGLAALLLLLEIRGGFSGLCFADLRSGSLRRLRAMLLPANPILAGSKVGRQTRVLAETSVRSRWPLENHAGLRHSRRDHVRGVRLLHHPDGRDCCPRPKPITPKEKPAAGNVVDLMEALRRSVGGASAEAKAPKKPAKKPRKAAAGQKEMLMPIEGKKPTKEPAAKKPSARAQRKSA